MIQKNAQDNAKVDLLGLSSSLGDDEKNFLGMVTCVDHNIGLLRKKIEDLGLKDKTIIIKMNHVVFLIYRFDVFYFSYFM